MIVRPYAEEGSKRDQVERMFDRISPTYDRMNRIFSMGIDQRWRRRTIDLLLSEPVDHVLDVATGTADLAIMAARRGVRVTGVDISEGMLTGGRKKVEQAGLQDRVTLQAADGESLPFPDGLFDAVMVAFGVRNFEHLEQGLGEMRRVLRPGGRSLILEFSRPRGPLAPLFRFYFHRIMPVIGRLVSKDMAAYSYLPLSVDAFPEGDAFLRILRGVGYVEASGWKLNGGIATLYLARA